MTTSQILLLAVFTLILLAFVGRQLRMRTLRRYSAGEAAQKIANKEAIMLDVRTDQERRAGYIKNSVHIPLQELRRRMKELEKLRNTEIICYCQSGNRSVSAALALQKAGYRSADMRGGIADWNYAHRTT